jgi:hypothetical protein
VCVTEHARFTLLLVTAAGAMLHADVVQPQFDAATLLNIETPPSLSRRVKWKRAFARCSWRLTLKLKLPGVPGVCVSLACEWHDEQWQLLLFGETVEGDYCKYSTV